MFAETVALGVGSAWWVLPQGFTGVSRAGGRGTASRLQVKGVGGGELNAMDRSRTDREGSSRRMIHFDAHLPLTWQPGQEVRREQASVSCGFEDHDSERWIAMESGKSECQLEQKVCRNEYGMLPGNDPSLSWRDPANRQKHIHSGCCRQVGVCTLSRAARLITGAPIRVSPPAGRLGAGCLLGFTALLCGSITSRVLPHFAHFVGTYLAIVLNGVTDKLAK